MTAFDGWAATFGQTHTALELAPDGGVLPDEDPLRPLPERPRSAGPLPPGRRPPHLRRPGPPGPRRHRRQGRRRRGPTQRHPPVLRAGAGQAGRGHPLHGGHTRDRQHAQGHRRRPPRPLGPPARRPRARPRRRQDCHRGPAHRRHLPRHPRSHARRHRWRTRTRPGGLQVVFCDVSTAAAEGWNAYDELRNELTRRDVPADAARYMQDAKTHAHKATSSQPAETAESPS